MRVRLDIDRIIFRDAHDGWWREGEFLPSILDSFSNLPFWTLFRFYGRVGSEHLKSFDDVEDLLKVCRSWKRAPYILASENTSSAESHITLILNTTSLGVQISIGESDLSRYSKVLIGQLIDFTCDLVQRLQGVASFGPRLGILVQGVPYPRVRPPRNDRVWESGGVVEFASREFHTEDAKGRPEQVDILAEVPTPKNVRRTECGDLLVLSWTDDLSDQEIITTALTQHDRWLAEILELTIDGAFNEQGDQIETVVALEKHDLLTFYDAFTRAGYKGVVVKADGTVDEELFEEIAIWAQEKGLPDGTILNELNLITPTREAAIRIADRAHSIGVNKVLYADDDGNFWDPDPPGLWLE